MAVSQAQAAELAALLAPLRMGVELVLASPHWWLWAALLLAVIGRLRAAPLLLLSVVAGQLLALVAPDGWRAWLSPPVLQPALGAVLAAAAGWRLWCWRRARPALPPAVLLAVLLGVGHGALLLHAVAAAGVPAALLGVDLALAMVASWSLLLVQLWRRLSGFVDQAFVVHSAALACGLYLVAQPLLLAALSR